MSLSLLDLPNEILSTIFAHLDHPWSEINTYPPLTKPDLCALALTCRQLSELVREVIFRSISLIQEHSSLPDPLGKTPDNNRVKRLLRTWREYPTCYIDRLQQVNWLNYISSFPPSAEFFDHLGWSQSLQELNLIDCTTHDVKRIARLLSFSLRSTANFPALRVLRIRPAVRFANYTGTIPKLCTSQSLLHLEVGSYSISTLIDRREVEEAVRGPSALESLHFSNKSMVDVVDLGLILSVCKNLKRLKMASPIPGIKFDDGQRQRFPETNQRFSSAEIGRALLPIAATLENLSITDPSIIYYAQPDSTRLDLSSFKALRTLTISSFVLAGGHHLSVQSGRVDTRVIPLIWDTLPPTLEELNIEFDALQGIFYSLDTDERIGQGKFSDIYESLWKNGPGSRKIFEKSMQWITDLIERKRNQSALINLRRIRVVETHVTEFIRQKDSSINLELYNLRNEYTDIFGDFEDAGINVDILVYAPRHWKQQSSQISQAQDQCRE